MARGARRWFLQSCCVALGFVAGGGVHADALHAVQILRAGGCGGTVAAAKPLHREAALDRAAALWSQGYKPTAAIDRSGYTAEATTAVHVRGIETALIDSLRRTACPRLADASLQDVGVYQRGADYWILLSAPYVVPARVQAPALASRALQLVNSIRARGARCGGHVFGAAPPVRLSDTLGSVAFGHATDMASHDYFEHEDLSGRSPADRVRAVGYAEKLVGENIAYGPKTADEVVAGWLSSPGHCENIMDPRFAEMGIAFAPGRSGKRGLFWVQLLADPKI